MSERLDKLLAKRQLATSRTQAQHLICEGLFRVKVAGQWLVADKPSTKYPVNIDCQIDKSDEHRYVSRAGLKLAAALEENGLDVRDKTALDIGQSTGGFTDCLLQKGAKQVVGLEVGHGQLAESLQGDARVVCLEGVNARHMPQDCLLDLVPAGFDIVVIDVSFISQALILPGISAVMAPDSLLLSSVSYTHLQPHPNYPPSLLDHDRSLKHNPR